MGGWDNAYGIIADAQAANIRDAITRKQIAEAAFRKSAAQSPIISSSKKEEEKPSSLYSAKADNDDPDVDSFGDKAGDAAKSIGKRLIDALSVGTYAVMNTADEALDNAEEITKKIGDGDVGSALLDIAKTPFTAQKGVAEGVRAGFAGNEDYKTTGSDIVKRVQEDYTDTDADSKVSGNVQAGVGLAGDILLDPLTYATLGIAPLIKGAATGSRMGSKAAKKIVDEAAEKGRAAGMSEEAIQKQILDKPEAQLYDNRFSGAAKGAGKEYKAWRKERELAYIAKQENKAFKKSGQKAEGISPDLLGVKVEHELMPRPISDFANDGETSYAAGARRPEETTETAERAHREWEARREARRAGEQGSKAADEAEEASQDAAAAHTKETPKESLKTMSEELVDSIQGAPVKVGDEADVPKNTAKANDDLVNTLGSSRAQEIMDVLNNIQPKVSRYKKTTMRNVRKEYAARPSTIKVKKSKGLRQDQPEYQAKMAAKESPVEAPVSKEADMRPVVDGRHIRVDKLLAKLEEKAKRPSARVPTGKGNDRVNIKNQKPAQLVLRDIRKAMAAGDKAEVKRLVEDIHINYLTDDIRGPRINGPKIPKTGTAAKTIDEELDELLPENPLEELFDEVDELNPNAVTEQELVEKFGIREEDAGRLLDEIEDMVDDLDMSGNITAATIKGVSDHILSKHITPGEMALLKKLTGKDTAKEVAAEIRVIMNAQKRELNALKNPQKAAKPSKAEKTEEQLAGEAAAVEELADRIAKSPTALDAAVGKQRLLQEYKIAVDDVAAKYEKTPAMGDDVIRLGEEAVAKMHGYQSRTGDKVSGRGFQVTADEKNAWKKGAYGSHTNTTLHSALIGNLKKINNVDDLANVATGIKARQYLDMLRIADARARTLGIQPYQNFAGNIGKKPINLSMHDIFDELGEQTVRDLFFLKGRDYGFDVSQVTGAVETLMRGKAAGLDPNDIAKEIKTWFTNPQSKPGIGKKQQDNLKKATDSKRAAGKRDVDAFAESFAKKLLGDTTGIYNRLNYRMLLNSAQHASAVGKHIEDLTEPAIARISNAPTGRQFMEQMDIELAALKKEFDPEEWELAQTALESNVRAQKNISRSERQSMDLTNKVQNATKSTKAAKQAAADDAAKILPNGKPAHTEYGKKKAKNPDATPKAVHDARTEQSKITEEEIRASAPKDAEEFDIIGAYIAADMVKKLHPIKSYLVPSLGINGEGVYRAMNTGLHTVAHLQNNFHEQLLKHMSQYGSKQLSMDFKHIQQVAATNPGRLTSQLTTKSAVDLYNVIDTMFSVSGKNIFEANGVGAQHFNNLAASAGLHPHWRFKEGNTADQNMQLWRQWEGIDNVPDFLSKMHNVSVRAAQDISIAASFTKKFGVIGKRDGYVKIGRRADNDSTVGMFELINRDMYYPIEVARDFAAVDNLLRESRSVSGKTALGKFVINVMDPVTNALKASQTTVRPGHWVLSVVGDSLRNHIAGVNSITPYKQAIAVLKAGGHDMDAAIGPIVRYQNKATQLSNIYVEGESKGVTINVGGKHQNISNESLNRLMQSVIHLPPHAGGVMEDVLENPGTLMKFGEGLKKGTEFVTNNQGLKGNLSLNKWASIRDNWMRTTLALDFIQKGKFKNVEDMKKQMEDFVTKWAPTSTDFTAKEAKYARRTMLYYTWLRGITPRVVETMLTKPGVSTMMNKAQYAMAEANGLDPQSFGNPFPEEGLYPHYYYNSVLGPQWKDDDGGEWGINPSHPTIEVLNNFGGVDPAHPVESAEAIGKTAIGMSTPFFKMPLEMSLGQNSSGIPIEDNSQYLLDNLGGSWISTLSRATGKTVNENGIVDRTDSANRNTTEDQIEHAKLQGINFMTGAKLTDYQSDSARKSARYAEQDKRKKEKEEARR